MDPFLITYIVGFIVTANVVAVVVFKEVSRDHDGDAPVFPLLMVGCLAGLLWPMLIVAAPAVFYLWSKR